MSHGLLERNMLTHALQVSLWINDPLMDSLTQAETRTWYQPSDLPPLSPSSVDVFSFADLSYFGRRESAVCSLQTLPVGCFLLLLLTLSLLISLFKSDICFSFKQINPAEARSVFNTAFDRWHLNVVWIWICFVALLVSLLKRQNKAETFWHWRGLISKLNSLFSKTRLILWRLWFTWIHKQWR